MSCVHLKKLYELCEQEELRIGGADLVRLVCTQCGEQEVCPSMLMEEYDATHPDPNVDLEQDVTSDAAETD